MFKIKRNIILIHFQIDNENRRIDIMQRNKLNIIYFIYIINAYIVSEINKMQTLSTINT